MSSTLVSRMLLHWFLTQHKLSLQKTFPPQYGQSAWEAASERQFTEKAGDETRTRDSLLGRQELYQLSYSRMKLALQAA